MKKLVFSILTLLVGGVAYALPVGNPADPALPCDGIFWEGHCGDPCDPCLTWCDAWSFRFGFYGDYVFERHTEVDDNLDDSDVQHTEIYTNAGFIAFNMYDRFDLFATLGATQVKFDSPSFTFGIQPPNEPHLFLESETDFSWSLGVRGVIWECGNFTFGMEGQYFYTRPHITYVYLEGVTTIFYPADTVNLKYREWQVGGGISYTIDIVPYATAVVPYIALKWSHGQIDMDDAIAVFPSITLSPNATLHDLETKKEWGYAVGVTLVGCNKFTFTIEGRFADETAAYLNGQIRF